MSVVILTHESMHRFAVLLVACFVVSALAEIRPVSVRRSPKVTSLPSSLDPLECKVCVEFMNNAIYDLEQIIVNGGVFSGCEQLCSYLNTQVEQAICNLLCEYVGVDAFIALLRDIDPDSIYYCQQLTVCPIQDYIKGKMNYLRVDPTAGPVGTKFNVTYSYALYNSTGTSISNLLVLMANPLDDPMGKDDLLVNVAGGTYISQATVWANPDPVTGEDWSPGQYTITLHLCEGTCESSHPHAYFLSFAQTNFQIFDGTTSS